MLFDEAIMQNFFGLFLKILFLKVIIIIIYSKKYSLNTYIGKY